MATKGLEKRVYASQLIGSYYVTDWVLIKYTSIQD